jgi:hypothetical protein
MTRLTQNTLDYWKGKAERQACEERFPDWNPAAYGNFYDAYADGLQDGETRFAREILEMLDEPYTVKTA